MNQVAGILFDLGVSSPQLENAARGFSFQSEGPLDMRMDPGSGVSALEWLNSSSIQEIETVLKIYGEEPNARKIAKAIKSSTTLLTTLDLAKLVARASGRHSHHSRNAATRTFLAIRLYLNQELEELHQALHGTLDLLKVGGRLVVISFHSLEDRIVKKFIHKFSHPKRAPKNLPVADDYSQMHLKKIGRSIVPSPQEISRNQRVRSARLRVAEKIDPELFQNE